MNMQLSELIKLLAREGALEILFAIDENGHIRYKELAGIVESETTLTRRLDELTSSGILGRELLDEKYRPTEYSLTEYGRKVLKVLQELK
jgi:DNA-binding HxlR family transcriptional regulator